MKKWLVLTVALTSVVMSFALPISLGVKAEYAPIWDSTTLSVLGTEVKAKTSMNTIGFGAFIDVDYVQLGLDYVMSVGPKKIKVISETENNPKLQALTVSLLGKYPIGLARKIAIFPMLGLSYTHVFSAEKGGVKVDTETRKKMSDIYVLGGVGLDIGLGFVYLRPTLLYGINLTGKDSNLPASASFFGSTLKIGLSLGFSL